ncbi:MAG: NADH-quinone oxidoreductase subunit C [Patescibacteria group bacterium]
MTLVDQLNKTLADWPHLAQSIEQNGDRYQFTVPVETWYQVASAVKRTFTHARVSNYFATDERVQSKGFGLYLIWSVDAEKSILILRTVVPEQSSEYHSLAALSVAAARYERDIWDMFGLIPSNHPELKSVIAHSDWPTDFFPLRKDVAWNAPVKRTPDARPYPFKRYEGEGIYEVPVGPIHAGVIEPGHFRFQVAGEPIQNLEIRLGWKHRGVEKLFEHLPQDKWLHLSEQISGDNSIAHSAGLCAAVEDAAGVTIPIRAQWLRMIFLELERVNTHLHDLANMNVGIGCNFGASQLWRLREQLLELNRELTGSRFLRGVNTLGGVKQDLTQDQQHRLLAELKRIAAEMNEILKIVLAMPSALDRLETTGLLKKQVAEDLGVVGVGARASGIHIDARRDFPTWQYAKIQFTVPVRKEGDVLARFLLRRDELLESIHIIEQCLSGLKQAGEIQTSVDLNPNSFGWSCVESNRGELQYVVMTDSQGKINRVKIRDAGFHNWDALAWCVLGNIIPDFPLCNKSFNLSYSGHDL